MAELAHYPIFGVDLVIYIGTAALILFMFVALIRSMNENILKERVKIHPKWHHRIAILAILLVIIHVAVQYIEI